MSKRIEDEDSLSEEHKQLLISLPREEGWFCDVYKYQGFWYGPRHLQALIAANTNFDAKDSDVFIVSAPKSGTTWLKAITFALLNRHQHALTDADHPLLARNSHDLVPFLERPRDLNLKLSSPSPRLFSTHAPYSFLPESVKQNPTCKMVYICRNPKDTLVSFCHFSNKLKLVRGMDASSIEHMSDMYIRGVSPFGPVWDHVLQYWEESKRNPDRVLFLKYEEMSAFHVRRLAEFLNLPFTATEEESGMAEKILKFCSFEHLSSLEVNKSGKSEFGAPGDKNNAYFRKGVVGDYNKHLSSEMIEKLDRITRGKLFRSDLVL